MDTPTLSVPGTIPNSDLRPYKTREYEIGVDLRFLNNRIGIDYAYYDKETSDDIVTVTIPQASGYTGAKVNLGSIGNKGHELMLTLVPYAGDFRWEMNIMYSYNKSKVLDLGASSEVSLASFSAGGGGSIKQIVGERANAIYGYKQQFTEDGQPIWERWSFNYGGQQHYSWRPARNATQELLGYGGNPNMGSFTTTFTYKGVTLSAMIDAKWGGDMIYVGEQEMIERGQSVQTLPGRDGGLFLDGVYKVGDNYVDVADAAGYTINANAALNRPSAIVVAGNEIPYHVKHFENFYREGFTKRVSDKVLFDASYAKLREISLGYSLPQTTIKKWGLPFQSVRMTLVGRNLLDLYNDLPSGDPSTLSSSTMGVNNYALPALRSYTFNLDINF
jgi:outer membrane receptor protein involved in Fe transport